MNKPAHKEPSMDEILSSIRQIIADDDAAVAPAKPSPSAATSPAPAPRPFSGMPSGSSGQTPQASAFPSQSGMTPEPLPLSPDQIVAAGKQASDESDADDEAAFAAFAKEAELVDPEDIAFAPGEEDEEDAEQVVSSFSVELDEPEPAPEPQPLSQPKPQPQSQPQPQYQRQPQPSWQPQPRPATPPRREPPPSRPAESVGRTAPMPDPRLSSDMAEELLAPATGAAVKHTLSRLSGLSTVGAGVTLDDMIRDLLRPMLKDWLDEHLPSVVERVVEREIARISRGE